MPRAPPRSRRAAVPMSPQRLLPVVERLEALLRLGDPLFYAHDTGRGVDDLLIEFAPIVADRLDLAFEPRLVLQRSALLGAERFQLLVACLEGIQISRWGLGLRRRSWRLR